MSDLITAIALEGHDSELFAFLDAAYRQELLTHPAGKKPLWTFAETGECDELRSVPSWNTVPSCIAWTDIPPVHSESGWQNYRGMVTRDTLYRVQALALVRYFFVQGYTCLLDDQPWIEQPADPGLERLGYIRGWDGRDRMSDKWKAMQTYYFDWAFRALERLRLNYGWQSMSDVAT